jgi:hypothetical protein
MKLEFIVTLASPEVRLRFTAMERSLRATGCDLPLRVIPYNDRTFELPANAEWWLDEEMACWLSSWKAHPTMRKYQCLTQANFQFVDTDVIFLRDPTNVLEPLSGFVTSCGHWKNPNETLTAQSHRCFQESSTNWQTKVFNTGQWACDRALFSPDALRTKCEATDFKATCLTFPHHEQPGINLLVLSSGVPIHNLTLPPWNMESTWAGDYAEEYTSFWQNPETKPYFIHWAGMKMEEERPIHHLIDPYLSPKELEEWQIQVRKDADKRAMKRRSLRARLGRVKRACTSFLHTLKSI